MSWYATAALVISSAVQYENSEQTARRQDNQAATSILNQSRIQKSADTKVNDAVQELQGSNAADERQTRLDDYMGTLRRNRVATEEGLSPNVGSAAFKSDAGNAAAGVHDYAARTAGLLSRIDAPQLQRQGEAFGYGNLATDIQGIGRQSQGQSYIDQLRQNAIRRNAEMDLAAGVIGAAGGAMAGRAGSGGGSLKGTTYANGDGYTYNLPGYH